MKNKELNMENNMKIKKTKTKLNIKNKIKTAWANTTYFIYSILNQVLIPICIALILFVIIYVPIITTYNKNLNNAKKQFILNVKKELESEKPEDIENYTATTKYVVRTFNYDRYATNILIDYTTYYKKTELPTVQNVNVKKELVSVGQLVSGDMFLSTDDLNNNNFKVCLVVNTKAIGDEFFYLIGICSSITLEKAIADKVKFEPFNNSISDFTTQNKKVVKITMKNQNQLDYSSVNYIIQNKE